ncbi:MAG: spermidine/putrescine ABC transporter substrate-binding protein [Acidimicrobiales bacterium]|nr:MAG: spermidine/putrescine ABC transporter substrate-binding protein [Acidimicrobiales bacterium]
MVTIASLRNRFRLAAGVAAGVLTVSLLAGCGSSETTSGIASSLGDAEGSLNLIAWPGLVENGSTDSSVDWVRPFEQRTGCKVSVKTVTSSEQMRDLIDSNAYDGVSAPGELSGELINNGSAEPINTELVKNYRDVVPGLRMQPWNSFEGHAYGAPLGRSASLLTWRSDQVKAAPVSLAPLFAADSSYRQKVMIRDDAASLAAAALALRTTKPELKIGNPYALNREQFSAVIEQMRVAQQITNLYWSDYTEQVRAFEDGSSVIGLANQAVTSLMQARGTKVQTVLPDSGTVGSSDTWMLLRGAKHPSCMYRWMDHVLDAKINAQISEYYGQAPAVPGACANTVDKNFCQAYHAIDESYYRSVWIATAPQRRCVDGRNEACVAYPDWHRAWQQLRAG